MSDKTLEGLDVKFCSLGRLSNHHFVGLISAYPGGGWDFLQGEAVSMFLPDYGEKGVILKEFVKFWAHRGRLSPQFRASSYMP